MFWIEHEPKFASPALFLDSRVDIPFGYQNAVSSLPSLAALGVGIVAPPIFALIKHDEGEMVSSEYAAEAKEAGLEITTRNFERSGPLSRGGAYCYKNVNKTIRKDGDVFRVLDSIVRDLEAGRVFGDGGLLCQLFRVWLSEYR